MHNFVANIKYNIFFTQDQLNKVLFGYDKRVRILDKEEFVNKKLTTMWFFNKFCIAIYYLTFKKIDLRFSNRTTTQGYTIYLGPKWNQMDDFQKYKLIMHEMKHVEQWHKYKFLYTISYVLVLPALISFRAYWEYKAFSEEIYCYLSNRFSFNPSNIDRTAKEKSIDLAKTLCFSPYFFAGLLLYPIIKYFAYKKWIKILSAKSEG